MVSSQCLEAQLGIWGALGWGEVPLFSLCSCVLTPAPNSTTSRRESFPRLEEIILLSRSWIFCLWILLMALEQLFLLRVGNFYGLRVVLPFALSRPTPEAE